MNQSKNFLNSVKVDKPTSNMFDLSHDVKLSCNMGQLIPVMIQECIPGDVFRMKSEALVRFAPLVTPVMHRINVYMHYFFVPNRIIWPNWEKYITTGAYESVPPAHPFISLAEDAITDLLDYGGIPPFPTGGTITNANPLAFYAYNKIYNEYYRDQNLIDPIPDTANDGDNNPYADKFIIRKRAWEHDLFTAALPFAQKGAPVDLPLGAVVGDVTLKDGWNGTPVFTNIDGVTQTGDITQQVPPITNTGIFSSADLTKRTAYDPQGTLEVDADVEATTINDLRMAFRMQEWLEKNARGGTRYVENILVHFGVRSSDQRLQRPEYITGSMTPVSISEVLNTTGTEDLPQGNMAGHGISYSNGKNGQYRCEEHGWIIGIMSIIPRTAYQDGLAKHFLRINAPEEYAWPTFAHLGEEKVTIQEIYAYTPDKDDEFGYQPRYYDYRYAPSRVAADFRKPPLNAWHFGRKFESVPALNQEFIECTPTHDPFAVTDPSVQKLYVHVYNKVTALRKLPKFGTPSF